MKHIIQITEKNFSYLNNKNKYKNKDLVKLRLRGKGSGYFEGPAKLGILYYHIIGR